MTSMDALSEGVSWYERGAEKRPNRKTISNFLGVMQDMEMIAVESNKFGTVIYVMNWDTYQSQEDSNITTSIHHRAHPTGHPTGHPSRTTKEVQEVKEGKELLQHTSPIAGEAISSEGMIDEMGFEKKQAARVAYTEEFERFWKVHPQGSKAEAFKRFQKVKKSGEGMEELLVILNNQVEERRLPAPEGVFVSVLQDLCRWFSNKRWEDNPISNRPKGQAEHPAPTTRVLPFGVTFNTKGEAFKNGERAAQYDCV